MRSGGLAVCGLAVALLSGCIRGEHLESPDRPEITVRVGMLVDTPAAVISATSAFTITTLDGSVLARAAPSESWTFRADGQQLRASSAGGREIGPESGTLRVIPADTSALVSIGGKSYRGSALVRVARTGRVTAVNVVEFEDYLRGVVSFEIGRLPPAQIEAVKAQAIAARTYAAGNMNRWNERGFDFYATVQDQVYGGVSGEDSVTTRAVLETRGEIVTYQGKPIQAFYSSTCGGRTSGVRDSWPWREDQPYLKSVPDTMGASGRAYCETSSRYRWTVSWARDALRSVLAETFGARARRRLAITRPDPADAMQIERVESVELTGRNAADRSVSVRIRVDGHTHEIPGDSIRWFLRPDPNRSILNSSMLFALNSEVADGVIQKLEVQGGGWGHGVGMCQVGAINRAKAGQTYRQILAAYYSGTEIERLY